MQRFAKTPARSVLLISGILIAVIAGVGIPLGLNGTYEQPSWMPRGTGINIPSPSDYVFRPEMVIITSAAFKSTLQPLAQWKSQKGTPCIIKTTEDISAQYPGRDTPEKIRNCLKDLYANASLQWVLLAGDDSVVPMRYTYNDDVNQVNPPASETPGADRVSKPTDYYYSDLTGNWDTDNDGRWGESALNSQAHVDEIDWTPEVYVGRIPADNTGNLQAVVNKILNYEIHPVNGSWMNNFLLGGAVSDDRPGIYNDEAYLVQNITDSYVPSSMVVTLLMDTTSHYTPKPSFNNLTGGAFRDRFDAGQSLVHFQGHGSTALLADYYSNTIFSTSDANILTDNDQVPLMFAAACSTAAYDITSTLMESLLYPEHHGVIGYIGSMRVDWYFDLAVEQSCQNWLGSLNRGMARAFWSAFFSNNVHQPGKALALMKTNYIHSSWWQSPGMGSFDLEWERKNLLTYTLFGDPELSVYTAQLRTFGNPLPPVVYAGQRLQLPVKYNNSNYVVPGATVCIQSGDFYYTSHTSGGAFDVRLALDPRTYNLTITGPNMQPFNTTFTTVLDTTGPQILDVKGMPASAGTNPARFTVNDALNFSLQATDGESGIGAVILHVSYDNFASFANFSLQRNGASDWFQTTLTNLPPGHMQYYYTVMNYAENATILPSSATSYFSLNIDPLAIHYVIMVVGVGVAVLFGITIGVTVIKKWHTWKQYARSSRESAD